VPHLVTRCELTDAAVVETPVAAANGDTTIANVVYFDPLSGKRAILEVSVVTMGSETSLARTSKAEMGAAAGEMGPSMMVFLKIVYARAKSAGKRQMTRQPEIKYILAQHDGAIVFRHEPERGVPGDGRGVP
jgi:hypothetical protein